MNANIRTLVYSFLSVVAIGYLFGVIFALRAIRMSQLESELGEMLVLTGWVGLTFAVLFVPIGLVGLVLLAAFRRAYPARLSRWTRIYLLAWFVLATATSIPFLGYYYSSGIDPHMVAGADSPWDLMPRWFLQVGRWIGFSLLTANLLAIAATEMIVRYFGIRESDAPNRFWNRRLLLGVPLIVLALWLVPPAWLKLTQGRHTQDLVQEEGTRPQEIEPAPALGPLVIVGWDGVTWDVVDSLLVRGEMPNLASLIARGVRSPLTSFEPTSSPLIWTTISTGRPPGQHGVRSQVENRFAGMRRWFFFPSSMGFDRIFGRVWERFGIVDRVAVTSDSRRHKAFWNVASEFRRRVGLVNWRVAWPAEPVNGFNITDHLHPGLVRLVPQGGRLPDGLREQDLADMMPGAIEPPVSPSLLDSCLAAGRERTHQYAEMSGLPADLAPEPEAFATVLGLELSRRQNLDILGLYYYRPDAIEHQYWQYREPQYFFGPTTEELARYEDAIDQIHIFCDLLLGDILRSVPDNAIVMVISDHGHGPVFGELRRSGGHSHAPAGILVMAGPGIRVGSELLAPTVYDIFPTLMYISGMPIEREAKGRVLLEAFDEGVRVDRPVREIERYSPRDIEVRHREQTSPVDRELLDRLKRLGYIG